MKALISEALKFENNQLFVLNQQKLPMEEEWIICKSPEHMREIIYSLQVRGAPLIGIAAALALAQFVEQGADSDAIKQAAQMLKAARPTAVNLMYCIDRLMKTFTESGRSESIIKEAEVLFDEDIRLCQSIAEHGNSLIADGDNILTHCNTGSLVTAGKGTALGVLFYAHQQKKRIHVYVDETRPLLQGGRLTTWELKRRDIPYTLICDNMAASLMRMGKIQKVIVGADRIACNGDFANKIGTYSIAVLAHYHDIPFYVAAPYTTVDWNCASGDDIIIEERHQDEVHGIHFGMNKVQWSTPNSPVYNPAFDVTEAKLVTAYILDNGVFKPNEIRFIKL